MEDCTDRSGQHCSYVEVESVYQNESIVFTWWLTLGRDPYNNTKAKVEFAVLMTITIVGVITNILVLMVITGSKKLRKTATHQYTAALNINYLLFLTVGPMMLATRRVYMWTLSVGLCKMILYTFSTSASIAIWLFVFISMDRHIHIVQVVKKSRLAKVYPKYPMMATAVLVALSFLFFIPVTLFFEVLPVIDNECTESTKCFMGDMNQTVYICTSIWRSAAGALVWNILMVCISYLIPSVLISYNYWEIYRSVKKVRKRIRRRRGRKARKTEIEIQVTIMCGLLVVLFILMWTPLFIMIFLVQFARVHTQGEERISSDLFYWIFCLTLANAVVNPMVYAFMNKNFVKAWSDYRFPFTDKFSRCQKQPHCCIDETESSSSQSQPTHDHDHNQESSSRSQGNEVECEKVDQLPKNISGSLKDCKNEPGHNDVPIIFTTTSEDIKSINNPI